MNQTCECPSQTLAFQLQPLLSDLIMGIALAVIIVIARWMGIKIKASHSKLETIDRKIEEIATTSGTPVNRSN